MTTAPAPPAPRVLARLARRPAVPLAAGFLLALTLACAVAPQIAELRGRGPETLDLLNRLTPPSAVHPLGTDELGRDVLLRLLYGGRVSLAVGFAGALAAALVGTAVGLLAGTLGGPVDAFLMRLTDAVIALPLLPLLIVLSALDPAELGPLGPVIGDDAVRVVVIVALVGWTTAARLVRAEARALKGQTFVIAAEALGLSRARIMLRHVLPGCLSPVLVATSLSVGTVILTESTLSFLGLGIRPPTPSWGNMLTGAQETIWQAPLLAIYPGLAIFATALAVNALGDGLRDALDPGMAA